MRLISADRLTMAERAKLAPASRKARPTAVQRAGFAEAARTRRTLKARGPA